MKASTRFCRISLALVLAGACPLVLAQSTQKQETKASTVVIKSTDNQMFSVEPGPHTFAYVGSEMAFEGGVVKGAPYSAQGTTTFTQTLADGNRISRQTTSQVFRDSEGRTRREETIGAIGPWASGTDAIQMIHIYDPVSGTGFMLNPKDRTASKMMVKLHIDALKRAAEDNEKVALKKKQAAGGAAGTVVSGDTVTVHVAPPLPGAPMPMMARIPGDSMAAMKGQVNKESLGTQEIEGVQAEGTRTTFTIPAGQIGNEQPIQVISETWYSPDLQVVVMSKHSDPRTGEQVYRLTNINRSEPARQLFEIPADYTVQESGALMRNFKYEMHTGGDKKQNEQ
jgi:hypothetical protein